MGKPDDPDVPNLRHKFIGYADYYRERQPMVGALVLEDVLA